MDRFYKRLLRLYPRPFREAYASAMTEMFEMRRADAFTENNPVARWGFFAREVIGLLAAAIRQRVTGTRRRGGRAPQLEPRPTHKRRGSELMSGLTQDLRHAVRRLLHAPGFSAAAVITLGLGIGANAAIFSVVHGVVLNPLPYPDSDRVVWVSHSAPGIGVSEDLEVPQGMYFLYRDQSRTLEQIALFGGSDMTLSDGGDPVRIRIARATYTLGDVLQVPPALGRWINEDDDFANRTSVVVLSHGIWQRRFGGDPAVIGRTIRMNNFPFEIVGVMPSTFAFPDTDTDAWIPRVIREANGFGGFRDKSVARLKPGVSAAEAQADLNGTLPLLRERYSGDMVTSILDNARLGTLVQPLQEHMVGTIEQTLWILLGTVGFVLLIACANVANLFLVRTEARQREVAIRTALGADRRQMVRYFLTESSVLAAVGGALGLLLAFVGVRSLVASGPAMIPRLHEVSISAPVLAFTAAVTIFAAFLFGAIPVLRATPDLVASLKEGSQGATTGRRRFHLRQALVCGQIALALVLLVGSGLMVRSFWHLKNVDPGFDAQNVLTFEIGLEGASGNYRAKSDAAAFHTSLLERIRGLPGVTSAGAVNCLPLSSWCGGDPLVERGVPVDPTVIPPIVAQRTVAPGYFETARIPLIAGRLIERSDHEQVTDVVVVSRRLAELYWPDEDPLGKQIYMGMAPPDSGWLTIVGVVGDVQTGNLTDGPSPLIYFPLVYTGPRGPSPHTMTFTVRTATPSLGLVDVIRREARELDAGVPFAHVRTLEQLVAESGMQMAFTMVLLVIAGGVALTLGLVGVYGVISYVVGQRRNEIGVRLALGARGADVRRMVLQQSGAVAAIGLGIGLAGAFGMTRLMEALLFGVTPTDPLTYGTVSVALLAVTILASYLPARRAAGIDPVQALKSE
jgi:predicted permease